MREFLLELYLQYGERAIDFSAGKTSEEWDIFGNLEMAEYLTWAQVALDHPVRCYLSPKALALIRNDS